FYVDVTGDDSVLAEEVQLIDGPPLEPDHVENYLQPEVSKQKVTVFEHCARAIDRSLTAGQHGLPLIGSGDWNDGMNRIGVEGKGESVWLGWFLCTVIESFLPLCEESVSESGAPATGSNPKSDRAKRYRRYLEKLKPSLEQAWDGDW